jgi:hypothetical protein
MRTKLTLICSLFLALILFSNTVLANNTIDGIGGNGATSKNEVNGTVYQNESRKPLRDVVVTAYSNNKKESRAYTDDRGIYAFSDLKPGVYRLVFERDGYRKVSREKVLIKTGEGYQIDIGMEEVNDFDWVPGIFNFSGGE